MSEKRVLPRAMKKIIWAVVVVAIVAGVVLLLGSRKKSEPKYRTATVDRGDVTQTVTATGALSAVTTVKVGSQVSGIIAKLHSDFNSQVKKGELLAELDPTFKKGLQPIRRRWRRRWSKCATRRFCCAARPRSRRRASLPRRISIRRRPTTTPGARPSRRHGRR